MEAELPSGLHRETLLRDALARDGTRAAYDFIFYDTPPNFGFHTVNALAATDYVLIPLQMSGFAVRGLKEVLRAVHLARSRLNPELRVLGMAPTFVNVRTNFSRQLLSGLADLAGLRVFQTLIAPTVKLQETSLAGVPIVAYAPDLEGGGGVPGARRRGAADCLIPPRPRTPRASPPGSASRPGRWPAGSPPPRSRGWSGSRCADIDTAAMAGAPGHGR